MERDEVELVFGRNQEWAGILQNFNYKYKDGKSSREYYQMKKYIKIKWTLFYI